MPRSLWLSQAARELVVGARLGGDHGLVHGVDGHLRRDLARRRAAHAVAHQKQRAPLGERKLCRRVELRLAQVAAQVGHQQVVFVVLANQPHIGFSEDLYLDVWGTHRWGVGAEAGRGPPSLALTQLEPQEFVAKSDHVARDQHVGRS